MNNKDGEDRDLNREQLKAVKHGRGPLLIIAGAGTGKTTVVTERIKYLIASKKALPSEILALTFTEKATREMEERIDRALPYGITHMWISTFHAFCDRIFRSEAVNIGFDPAYKLMTDAETIHFFRKHLFEFNLEYFRPLGNPNKFIEAMLTHFDRLRDEDITPKQYYEWVKSKTQSASRRTIFRQIPKTPPAQAVKSQIESNKSNLVNKTNSANEELGKYMELAQAFRKYEELKTREGVVDYADLISNTVKLFRLRKDVLLKYQNQFKYILIDEFQDTNYVQNELVVMLAGKRKNITVVGDDDQSIYRFRGAAISNIIYFRKKFPQTKIIVLTKNYRSTAEILDKSYNLIQNNNPDRLEKAEKIDKKLESMRRIIGDKIEVILTDRVENEADETAKKIKYLHDLEDKTKQQYKWCDFAILVRANNHSLPFTRALSRFGIPYQFLGPGQLFKQNEVKDLVAYLKLINNFGDSVACYRVLSMEWLSLGARDLAVLLNHSRSYGLSLFESCEYGAEKFTPAFSNNTSIPPPLISGDARSKIEIFVDMIHAHLKLVQKETAGQILYYFLESSGLLSKLVTYKNVIDEKVALNIAKFFDRLKTYEVEHEDATVATVVDWIDLSMTLGESPRASDIDWTENDAVNILTIHSAKGLEFPVVFLVNLVSSRFPTIERKEQIPIPDEIIKEILPIGDYHIQEERRLFYVGITRARDRLFLTASKYYGEGKREKKWSPFIIETLGPSAISVPVLFDNKTDQLSFLDFAKPIEANMSPVKHPITYLSHSQLDTFDTCPLQYRYKFILRIPVPIKASLTFGDTIHRTIKEFYDRVKAGNNPDLENLLSIYQKNWVASGFGDKNYESKMKKQGEIILSGYYEKSYDPKIIPVDLELPFKIKITPKLTLGGKIDRIDKHADGTLEIIDYKTGQPSLSKDPAKDQQLTVYALAACDPGLYNQKPDQVIVSFYYFDTQEKVTSTRSQTELELARAKIAKTAQEISVSLFPAKPGRQCDFCEFRLICEAWQ